MSATTLVDVHDSSGVTSAPRLTVPGERMRLAAPRLADVAAAVVLAAASVALLLSDVDADARTVVTDPDALGVALAIAACAPVAVHRALPAPAAVVALLAAGASGLLGYSVALPVLVALLLSGRVAVDRHGPETIAVGALSGIAIAASAVNGVEHGVIVRAIGGFAVGVLPALIGNAIRGERVQVREAHELARKVEELRDRDVERAVVQERLRIARDVHDITGHHLSAIALQSGGAGRTTHDPGARAAFERIHGLTTEALGQTRRALGVLRETGPAARSPAPRLAHVEQLLAPARDAGLAVELHRDGPERPLPDEVEVCAYRVVQESLTNVVRHAGAAKVVVRVEYGEHDVSVTVEDDGLGAPPRRDGGGLAGMRERVALVDGSFQAGPAGNGWSVRATLPTEARR